MIRPIAPSTTPPVKPAMMPRTVPIATVMSAADRAMVSDSVAPYMSLESTSRPRPGSTPSGWRRLMPPPKPLG